MPPPDDFHCKDCLTPAPCLECDGTGIRCSDTVCEGCNGAGMYDCDCDAKAALEVDL
jgi:hypothetical protein